MYDATSPATLRVFRSSRGSPALESPTSKALRAVQQASAYFVRVKAEVENGKSPGSLFTPTPWDPLQTRRKNMSGGPWFSPASRIASTARRRVSGYNAFLFRTQVLGPGLCGSRE